MRNQHLYSTCRTSQDNPGLREELNTILHLPRLDPHSLSGGAMCKTVDTALWCKRKQNLTFETNPGNLDSSCWFKRSHIQGLKQKFRVFLSKNFPAIFSF